MSAPKPGSPSPETLMAPKPLPEQPGNAAEGSKRQTNAQSDNRPKADHKDTDKSNRLTLRLKRNQSIDAATAELAVAGLVSNAVASVKYSGAAFGEVDLTACLTALEESVQRVHEGDLHDAEALLTAQAVSLNAVYTQLVRRATEYQDLKVVECLVRLGLKAQSQCRATLETLAVIKNPPTVFARQANISHGPQQVNNTVSLANEPASALACAENYEAAPNKLLEAHAERLDGEAADTTGRGDQALAPVGTLDRAKND
jgi:hypothetical protein